MNIRYFQIIGGIVMALLLSFAQLSAQTNVNMPANGAAVTQTITPPGTCFFNFFDSGGANSNYNHNADANITFAPSSPATHRIRVSFSAFLLEQGWDAFYIYNSNTVGTNQVPGPQGPTMSGFPGGNWQNISPGTITANTGIAAVGVNAAEALTFRFRSDASTAFAGWASVVNQVPIISCTMMAPNNLAGINTSVNDCFADVTTAAPVFMPGGCNTGYSLQYRINGGAANVVGISIPATITLQDVPRGNNIITWELVDPCGGAVITSSLQSVQVLDMVEPTITCPSNTTINLNAGECDAFFTYNVSCSDNCPFAASGIVEHPIDFNNGQDGIMFDVQNLGAGNMSLTEFGPVLEPGNWTVQVYITTAASTWQGNENNPGAWTLLSTQAVTSTGTFAGTPVPGFNIPLAPNESRGIYVTVTSGQAMNYTGGSRVVSDGNLRVSCSPGAGKAYPFGQTFVSRSYNGYVKYASTLSASPVLISGLPSGAIFPLGTTTNIYKCTDLAGNMSTCSFTVTVLEYPNPTLSLTCNDLISIALDETCSTTVGADQVLEGGFYKCYDNYLVQIDKIPPYGNGPWVPAVLGAADIGKTYGIRVTDPMTGNYCGGNIMVEDNLPPVLICQDLELPCNFTLDPGVSAVVSLTNKYTPGGLPETIMDFQTVELPIQVSAPAGATVNDVDFRVRINGDAFLFNINMELESPSGTVVTIWDQVGGCNPSPVFVRLDDEGAAALNCTNYTTDQRAKIPYNVGQMSAFDGEQVNGTWKLRVSDVDGFGDVSNLVTAELIINLSGTFTAGFPNDLQPWQLTQIAPKTYIVPAPLMDNCSDVTLTYVEQLVPSDCSTPYTSIINRTWTARDVSGNIGTCLQQLKLLRPDLDDVQLPPNYDDLDEASFPCSSEYPTPDWIEDQGLQGYPWVFSLPEGCSINWTYEDVVIQNADGTYTITRKWSIVDFCTSQTITHTQIIKVVDDIGPTITCPANTTVSTDVYQCCAKVNLPDVIVSDECSQIDNIHAYIEVHDQYTGEVITNYVVDGNLTTFPGNNLDNPDTLAAYGTTPCLPIGKHTVVYEAMDGSGNISSCSFYLTVKDYTPPVAVCDEYTIVAIGPDDPEDCYDPNNGCDFGGVTWVKAITFDDGSYDNCGFVKFSVRRAAPYSDCIQDLNKVNGGQPCDDGFPDPISEYDRATAEGDSVKFYCCEVGTSQMVILRVYQLDALGNISIGPDGTPIYNECQVEIEVQDKLKPGCQSPANVTVSCENFDPSLWAYGIPTVQDNCCLDSTKILMGQKGLTQSVSYTQFDTVCNKGTITRTFRVYDCHGFSSQCTQRIVVTYDQEYFVKFPDDKLITFCDSSGVYGAPEIFGQDCEQIGISYTDELFTVVPDACYKIERTWHIINWCTYDPNSPCIAVPNPNPNSTVNHPTNFPGPTVSPLGTPAPWAPTVVKIKPSDPQATNYSIYWDKDANCYQYKQIIKIVDTQDPEIVSCPATLDFCDLTGNDENLWNESYWWDALCQVHDLCEGPVDLTLTATDACSGANLNIRYLLFLDLDNDGTMETVVSSTNPPAAGTVQFGNANTPNFSGGTNRAYDHRPVPDIQKYRFAIQTFTSGNHKTANVRWNTQQSPNTFTIPELPYGTHKIKWIVEDGCGNEKVCEYNFVVRDCKAPTVVCLNGLTVNIMQTDMIQLFPPDFVQFAEDNCTPFDKLKFGMRVSGTGTGFPLDNAGNPVSNVVFTCDDIGTQTVEIWVMDKFGNADYCETYVIVQDNVGNCSSIAMGSVAGMLQTEELEGLEEGMVELNGSHPALPPVSMFQMSNTFGEYMFGDALPLASNYTVTPVNDNNPLNGVTTFDLVTMSKHILDLEPINTPYKLIAADINRSGSISTYDIVELRKLILGVYTELPENTSWRFVDKSFNFPNPQDPFLSPFPESKSVAAIQNSNMHDDFIAVKIGDINGSAIPSTLVLANDRSFGTTMFDIENREIKAGEEFSVNFTAADKVQGFQFTLNCNGLTPLQVIPGAGMSDDNFALFAQKGAVTTSWDNGGKAVQQNVSFTVKFRATTGGLLSDMLGVSSRITKAEAYAAADQSKLDVALRFNDKGSTIISGVGFELYQNAPNPFINKTMIGFHLPEATDAILSIYDETGRLIYSQKGAFEKGYNSFVVELADLGAASMLSYTVRTDKDFASRTMVHSK